MSTDQHISEESLRNDRDFLLFMQQELPNQAAPKNFTQLVMAKVELQPVPLRKEPWYQSLGLWIILTCIFVAFAAFFGVLYFLCDQNIMQMFSVMIHYLEKFEMEFPSFKTIFTHFSLNSTVVIVAFCVGFFALIDLFFFSSKKEILKK
ncbi:MAG: hypothetical protein PHR53_03240 [Bacteroidales bacterium]|nr:hypothetical protein [Bacteroidales bacterium]